MGKLSIAIIGAGTAGLAAAAFLARHHHVTVYERFDAVKPVGAGLLLQPVGLSVLAMLGLDQAAIEAGSRIASLNGKVVGSTCNTLDVHYKKLGKHLFGVGIHRSCLFDLLYQAAISAGAKLVAANEIVEVQDHGAQSAIVTASGEVTGPFDLVIDASGARSVLRKQYAFVKRERPYPYGAIWAIVQDHQGQFAPDILAQRYQRSHHMIGLLPVGQKRLALFWSLKVSDYAGWRAQPLGEWQAYVARLWPETEALLHQFGTHDDLAFANYSDVVLKRYYSGNVLFIGDSAHCTSPQLGQGANLALMDAMVLADCLHNRESLAQALAKYDANRRGHIKFYQMASRVLTPFFQSDSRFFPALRSLTCGPACCIPFSHKIAAHILSGTKTGVFSTLNPGLWAKNYGIKRLAARPALPDTAR